MKKIIIVLVATLLLVGLSHPVLADEGDNMLSVGDLACRLISWDVSADIWHGRVSINMTVWLENTGDTKIDIQWNGENSEWLRTIPANWHRQITLNTTLNIFTRETNTDIHGLLVT